MLNNDTAKVVDAAETRNTDHVDTAGQQAGSHKPSEQCREKESRPWVMAEANSLNAVNGHDVEPTADVTHTRVSLDAETGPTANRRRRKRYSPSQNKAQKVDATDDCDIADKI